MRKKVLHVINSLTPGGAETLLVNSLSQGGLQEYYDNQLAYFMGTSALQERVDKTIKVHDLAYKGYLGLAGTLRRLRQIIINEKIDIVHTHLNPAGVYTHFICPDNVPQVHTLHTTYSMDTMTQPSKLWLEKNFYFKKKSANLIFLSNYIKADFFKSVPFKGNAFVLNNFVQDEFFNLNPSQFNSSAGSPFKLLAVGNLNPVKNHKYLLEIFDYLKDANIELDIYGGGDVDAFKSVIADKGVKVAMKGFTANLADILPQYHLFIMPSVFEGFPLSLFEAMAAGLPCMVSDIEPLKEIAGGNVVYFDLTNAAGVAGQIKILSQSAGTLGSLSIAGKKHAENIASRSRYMMELSGIYTKISKQIH